MSAFENEELYWSTRCCVVTGGARGQGEAEVRRLLDLGATVIAVDRFGADDESWAQLRGIAEAASRLVIVGGDIGLEQTWAEVGEAVESGDRPVAGLINNAGVTLRKTVTETSLPEWESVLRVNLTGGFLGIRTLAPLMSPGGSIVNVSSTAGLTGYFSAAYTASKWAVRGLAKAAAIELAPLGIRVNTICPGLVDTPMARQPNSVYGEDQARAFYEGNREMTPLARGASAEEIADVAVFLLGPRAAFINAADIPVDGGMVGGGIYSYIGRKTGTIPGI